MGNIFGNMEAIQIVLDADLLRATDRAAKRARVNRSALVRRALHEYLKRMRILELETRDRKGYQRFVENSAEAAEWEQAAAWPEL